MVRIKVPTRERKILIQFTMFALIKVAISGFMVKFDAYQKSVWANKDEMRDTTYSSTLEKK